ncbi:hypothetical protein HII28_07190 [Planctomonas sp. JC2975]|uniref:hypothetical protein n=1 Tax=Planctomonas sp. JC2975 TaxID=2729626 RepID=UPI001475F632|nr:hypothetical protein [Planctomonas sp. JC2975]NNC11659.1 hypothetical protein [Planctomonas sp. JC2975]
MSVSVVATRWGAAATFVVLAVAGALIGAASVRILFSGTALVLIPWALCCLAIGAAIRSRWLAVTSAAVFGFAVAAAFLVGGYSGGGPMVGALPVFAALALLSAVVAAAASLAAHAVASALRRRRLERR